MLSPHLYAMLIDAEVKKAATVLSSSVVEQSAVNRMVVGSSPTWGVILHIKFFTIQINKAFISFNA